MCDKYWGNLIHISPSTHQAEGLNERQALTESE